MRWREIAGAPLVTPTRRTTTVPREVAAEPQPPGTRVRGHADRVQPMQDVGDRAARPMRARRRTTGTTAN